MIVGVSVPKSSDSATDSLPPMPSGPRIENGVASTAAPPPPPPSREALRRDALGMPNDCAAVVVVVVVAAAAVAAATDDANFDGGALERSSAPAVALSLAR